MDAVNIKILNFINTDIVNGSFLGIPIWTIDHAHEALICWSLLFKIRKCFLRLKAPIQRVCGWEPQFHLFLRNFTSDIMMPS
jgi:hypothetical protein